MFFRHAVAGADVVKTVVEATVDGADVVGTAVSATVVDDNVVDEAGVVVA
jgi:hypothetical protein